MPKTQRLTAYIGVDPGQNGGLVALLPRAVVWVTPMPATERDVWDWFTMHDCNDPRNNLYSVYAMIEKVHSMPKQGVASSFKFGVNYGMLRAFLVAAGMRFEEVTPRTWQKAIGISPRKKNETGVQWKNRLKAKAQQLFPHEHVTLKVADALLIAEYCKRKHKGWL